MLKENMKPENEEFHPFGLNFMIAPWRIEGRIMEKIDHYEKKPYKRLPVRFEPIAATLVKLGQS